MLKLMLNAMFVYHDSAVTIFITCNENRTKPDPFTFQIRKGYSSYSTCAQCTTFCHCVCMNFQRIF